jgi:hypothetical protein
MKYLRFMRVGLVPVLAILVLGASFISPALASNKTARHSSQTAQQAANSSMNAIIYLTTGSLASTFQSRISQQVPESVNTAIVNMVSRLPAQDRALVYEMATTLIQPSATLVSLTPQRGGLAMTLQLRLYPGDPKPITASMLISFRVLNSSTAQVSASPLWGPALVNGPLSTFQIPLGSLNSIKSTPGCGNAALAMNLQFPVTLGQVQRVTSNSASSQHDLTANLSAATLNRPGVNSFIEIPAASLSSLSGTFGSMPAGNNFTAKNIRLIVQGGNIHILSDIYWYGLYIGTADTTVAPSAGGGNLVLHVLSTNLRLFGLFTFPMNNYNQQIQQSLNSKLGNAFAGKFYVAQAGIGPNSLLPCAAGDSLLLTGNMSALG